MSQITLLKTKEEFQQFVDLFYQKHKKPKSFGICRSDLSRIDSSKVISVNFPYLNFEQNFGSFAVFATAAKIDFYNFEQNSYNEFIAPVDEEFVLRAFCLYYPFILEVLQKFVDRAKERAIEEKDDKIVQHATEVMENFTKTCEQYANNEESNISLPYFTLFLESDGLFYKLMELHKNIQVLFMVATHLHINTLAHQIFQFSAFYEDLQPKTLHIAYMKLHALSAGYAPLRSLNLDSIFGLLPNLAWSGNKPYELEYLRENEIALKFANQFPCIDFIDKFPRYLMQVLPQADNIRILDTAKTRFGAFLGAGYTQMPGASYVNFNSGALGACMNEGRISSSVVVGEGTDIGGGASILGVLSGGNTTPISIGKNCLLGANSVTGISLGDGCIVDAGISILAGSIVQIKEEDAIKIKEVNPDFTLSQSNLYKGHQLSGFNGLHFRITSQDSCLIAFRSAREITLNQDLH